MRAAHIVPAALRTLPKKRVRGEYRKKQRRSRMLNKSGWKQARGDDQLEGAEG